MNEPWQPSSECSPDSRRCWFLGKAARLDEAIRGLIQSFQRLVLPGCFCVDLVCELLERQGCALKVQRLIFFRAKDLTPETEWSSVAKAGDERLKHWPTPVLLIPLWLRSRLKLWSEFATAQRRAEAWQDLGEQVRLDPPKEQIGVRNCEVAALAVADRARVCARTLRAYCKHTVAQEEARAATSGDCVDV